MTEQDVRKQPLEPGGMLNRVIRIVGHPGIVRAVVEDDFHHFRVTLRHDGRVVTDVTSESPRAPYSLCPAAGLRLRLIVGMELTSDPTATARLIDAREQCTHQFDLAGLALAAAARGTTERRYDVSVTDEVAGQQHATLLRDGARVLEWDISHYEVIGPPPYAGLALGSGFTSRVAQMGDPQAAEDALVLRRGIFISGGRGMAEWLDNLEHASLTGGCWVQQPAQYQQAKRNRGSTQDFAKRADELTLSDEQWLAAAP